MSSGVDGYSGNQHEPSPNRFLFVSSDGLHDTLKKDVRAHISKYNRREARLRASRTQRGLRARVYQPSMDAEPESQTKIAKKVERKEDLPILVSVSSSSSPDSGYDSTASNFLQEIARGPLGKTRARLSSILPADNSGLAEDQQFARGLCMVEAGINHFPPNESCGDAQAIVAATYVGDGRAKDLENRRTVMQTGSAWSPVNSMPLDPFQSLPLPLDHTDQSILLSFQLIPAAVYNVPGSRTINNCRDWAFPLILKTPMLIYAAMAVVTAGREVKMGIQHSATTLAYKSCHIRTLNQWIRNPMKQYSAEVLIGIAALIASEHYRGWSPSLALHVRAFSQILRACGGWSSLDNDPRSGWFLFGQAILWSQVTVASLLGADDTLSAFRTSIDADIQDLLQARDELLQMLSGWIMWARRKANKAIGDLDDDERRYTHLLGEDTLLFKLLHSPDYLESSRARTVEVERSHQVFAIIYLVIVKWEHRDRPQDFLTFLDGLTRQMRLHDISRTSTNIPLVWLFIRGVDARPQRKVHALGLLKVMHILQPRLKERLLQFLLRLLLFDSSSSMSLLSFEDLEALDQAVAVTFPRNTR